MTTIKPEYYIQIDSDLRRQHDIYVGQELPNGFSTFTLSEQIQRYSKTLAFWMSQREKVQIKMNQGRANGVTMARMFFVSQQYSEFINVIRSKFDSDVCEQIHELARGYKQVMSDLMSYFYKEDDDDDDEQEEDKEKDIEKEVVNEWLHQKYSC